MEGIGAADAILITTISTVVTIVGIIVGVWTWKKPQRLPGNHATPVPTAAEKRVVLNHVNFDLRRSEPLLQEDRVTAKNREVAVDEPELDVADEFDPFVCDEGPYEVQPGSFEEIPLDVSGGDLVVGKVYGDNDFDFDIVDEDNHVAILRDEEYESPTMGERDRAYRIEWLVENDGPWTLLLSAPRRRYDRNVHVQLRKEPEMDN